MANLVSKPFYEGAPLDPNKLNDLLTDITTTFGSAQLANQTLDGFSKQFKIIYDCGRVSIPNLTIANKAEYADIEFENTAFDAGIVGVNPIIVTATVSTNFIPNKVTVSSLVKYTSGKTKFQVGAVATGPISNITIDWIAIQKIPTA